MEVTDVRETKLWERETLMQTDSKFDADDDSSDEE